MRKTAFIAACAAVSILSACTDSDKAGDGPEPGVEEEIGSDLETSTDDYVVAARDFGMLELGGKIEGPVGPEVNASFATELASIGDLESYVACAKDKPTCNPASAGADAVYTYVHRVTPGIDEPNSDGLPQPEAVEPVEEASVFRMTVPAAGFTGFAGYSLEEARAAMGSTAAFTIKCEEDMLIFEKSAGEDWATGEPITFFWKSKAPPEGPAESYQIVADGKTGTAAGPTPAEGVPGEGSGCA